LSPPRAAFPPSPADGFRFFGYVTIDGPTEVMTVSLRDLDDGKELFSVDLTP
jgi:alkaline phosphatase D